ncbi:embigin isoform X2 [Channa argus]|uniref:embigin isoform X2 n=1 Tax=Channa argus TaxID=215402 RepID=UPI0035212E51
MPASWKKLFFLILLLISCRHINTTGPVPTTPVPISPLPTDARSVVLEGYNHTEKVELMSPVQLELQCIWSGNQNKPQNITGYWRFNGKEIEDSRLTVQLENGQYNLTRVFSIVSEENLGNYSCVFGDEAKIDFILSAPQAGYIRDKPIIGYVGDSVVMTCHMEDTKPKPITWNWYRENGTEKLQIVTTAEPHHYNIKSEDYDTKLVVENLTEADSGLYYCGAVYGISITITPVELKVITYWEPLKPFIAILVEVIILVAAIALYERSQSKKNHAEENGANAEETNAPTQEEPEGNSSVRQRKV